MSRARRLLVGLISASAAAILVLGFLPWLEFDSTGVIGCFGYCDPTDIRGTSVAGVTGFGDGYVVAALGILMLLLTPALAGATRPLAALAIVGAALTTMTITAFDLLTQGDTTPYVSLEPAAALYGEVALAIVVAVCGGVLIGGRTRADQTDSAGA